MIFLTENYNLVTLYHFLFFFNSWYLKSKCLETVAPALFSLLRVNGSKFILFIFRLLLKVNNLDSNFLDVILAFI